MITNVLTTTPPVSDMKVTDQIHARLDERGIVPGEHLVDAGYIDAGHILNAAADHGITLIGPLRSDTNVQKTSDQGFDNSRFSIDWDNKQVICPNGQSSVTWHPANSHRGTPVTRVRFAPRHCNPCPVKQHCTDSVNGRSLTLRPRAEHEILIRNRAEQQESGWRQCYQQRCGIEGTMSQAVNRYEARRSRYRGTAKTALQHLLTATAINLARLDGWITGVPLAATRASPFMAIRLAVQ
ncbi:transposase [Streptosporangium canum]|uniref:transposase n=2 Tax=Streptosporangium canum TaxID=324952 RepID=UPI0034262B4F